MTARKPHAAPGVEALPELGEGRNDQFSFLVRTPAGFWWRQRAAARLLAERESPILDGVRLTLLRTASWRPGAPGEFLARYQHVPAKPARSRMLRSTLGLGAMLFALGALAFYAGLLPEPGAKVQAAPSPAPPAPLPKLRLLGAMLSGAQRAALIETPDGASAVVEEGAAVAGGVLESVSRTGAVVRYGQRQLRLQLEEVEPLAAAGPAVPLAEVLVEPLPDQPLLPALRAAPVATEENN